MFKDEIFGMGLWAQSMAAEASTGTWPSDRDLYQLKIRGELYDRNRERLGLLPTLVRQGIEAVYQDLKATVHEGEKLLDELRQDPSRSRLSNYEPQREFAQQLRYLADRIEDIHMRIHEDEKIDILFVGRLARWRRKRSHRVRTVRRNT